MIILCYGLQAFNSPRMELIEVVRNSFGRIFIKYTLVLLHEHTGNSKHFKTFFANHDGSFKALDIWKNVDMY